MSRKNIHRAGPDNHDEIITSFRMEKDKTYTKVTKIMRRDWKTGGIKSLKRNKPVEEGPYELVAAGETYDEKMQYEDHDGSMTAIYFRKATEDFKRVEIDEPDDEE